MPPVRKKHLNAKLDNTRVHPRALEQLPGLAQSPKCVEMSKVSIKGKQKALPAVTEPDTNMIGSVEIVKEIPQRASVPHRIGESSKSPLATSKQSENAASKSAPKLTSQPKAATKAESANLALCSAAISGFEATLLPLTNGSNRQFVDSMRVYLRAAIAQYMATGPASTPPDLPLRPANPFPKAPDARSTPTPAVPALSIKSTWDTAAKNGLRQKAVPTAKVVPRPKAKAQLKETPKAKFDKRLFLRLEKDYPWRKLSTSSVRTKLEYKFGYFNQEITSLHRGRTGFAMLAKKDTLRQETLDGSLKLASENVKLEASSDLVALQMPNVPVSLVTVCGPRAVDARWVSAKILSTTGALPTQVRPHGTCRPGAPYQNWHALFSRDCAPRAGFRIFYESGMATIHKPCHQIEQCKRCLGFHTTRGCSRAPACWNCGSNMHSEYKCKALTKCRNCGGPHRSDSRDCQVRPRKSGPVTKEQLARIRHLEQGKFTVAARARAAAKKAEEAIVAAAKDVAMAEATGFGMLGSEEEV
ncbi:EKA-like protein [Blumeria hordei DH14]|uniref:EKA-like protein n=1 Tax=Blumeria graminis f. sp. hordei (strain DH14) TaxID=546991 RepID=N1JIS7_BLUG1|nr:EKA-like protein [Blumeria hordei DH14]